MKPKIDYLGKVSCTVSKDYWSSEKDYDKLTIVEKEGEFGTFISRKPVLAGTPLTNREFWIPFSSVKESIVLDYNSFKDKYDKTLEEYKISLDDVISRLKVLEESENNIAELIEIANEALYKANNALTAVANINNKLAKPNGIATLDSTGKVPLNQLPNNIGGGSNLELGETSTTAYPGDKGKKNADAISSLTNALDSIDSYSKTTRNQLDAFKNTKGQALGIVPLDENGKVASSYLPSYVDDVLEYDNRTAFPTTGESGKIYIALDTNKTYRWGGTTYVELSSSVTLGETSSTAYAGDKGKKNREDINNLRDSFDSLANHVDEVNNKTNTNTTAIEELTTEVDSTNTEVNTINGNISKLNTTIGDVRSSFNNYASEKTPIIDKVEPHIADTQNPHSVTKTQVGLSNVTNDSQVKRSEMGANNGVATLDDNGKIPESQLPAGVTSSLVLGETEGTAYEGSKGAKHENAFNTFNSLNVYSNIRVLSTNTAIEIYGYKLRYNDSLLSGTDTQIAYIRVVDSTKTSGCGPLLNTDKKKLDGLFSIAGGLQDIDIANPTNNGITLGLDYYTFNNTTGETGTNTRNIYIPVADATKADGSGLMLNSDKTKLDSLSNYTLPIADSTTLGGIKIGSGLNIDSNGVVNVDNKLYILVDSLESVTTPDANKIYLVLNSNSTSQTNSFTEYVWITSDTGGKWEKLGEASATVDLDDYYNKTEIDNKLAFKDNLPNNIIGSVSGTILDSGDYTDGFKLSFSGSNIESGTVSNKNITIPVSSKTSLGLIKGVSSSSIDGYEVGTKGITYRGEICSDLDSNEAFIKYKYPRPSPTSTEPGLMSYADKAIINSLDSNGSFVSEVSIDSTYNTGIKLNVKSINTDDSSLINEPIILSVATTGRDGLMSSADKIHLSSCITSADYANETTTGVITAKIGSLDDLIILTDPQPTVTYNYQRKLFKLEVDSNSTNAAFIPIPVPDVATTTKDGLMSSANLKQHNTLYSIARGNIVSEVSGSVNGNNYFLSVTKKGIDTNGTQITTGSSITLPLASTTSCGLMSKEDKTKLDTCITSIPEAGYKVLGGIKATNTIVENSPFMIKGTRVNTVDGFADFVWENTNERIGAHYQIIREATTEKYGLMSPSDKVKLNNINVANSEYLQGYIEVLHSGNSFKLHCQSVKFSDDDDYEYYDINIPIATNSACGLLSKEDKIKLDNLSSGGSSNITEYTEAEITTLLDQIKF